MDTAEMLHLYLIRALSIGMVTLIFILAGCANQADLPEMPLQTTLTAEIVTPLSSPQLTGLPEIKPAESTPTLSPLTPAAPATTTSTPPGETQLTDTPKVVMTDNAPHVSPYIKVTVTKVDIRYLDTNPVQVELVIWGTLPDQCKYDFYSIENRNNTQVKISLDGIHPSDSTCANTSQAVQYVLKLGRDFPEKNRGFAQGEYKLIVNNFQTNFLIK
jgi:hypothetical protein